ncbi:apolipoprotein N-acyltransferase [bacterium]|nr:apolipoprotein N-acyltransferase [bacterium]
MNAGSYRWHLIATQLSEINPWLLTLLSALLYSLCFPEHNQGWLAWFAFVPLLFVCSKVPTGKAFMLGLIWGVSVNLLVFFWIFLVTGFGFLQALPLHLYFGLYGALFCAVLALFAQKKIPFLVSAPMLWVVLEYLKHHAGFLSFPMASLAHTQYRNVWFIQTASWTGEYGLSFWIIAFNSVVVDYFVRKHGRPVLIVLIIIAGLHLVGMTRLKQPGPSETITIAVVQPCIFRSERATEHTIHQTLDRLIFYTKRAASQKPDLIVWPETAVRDLHYDPDLQRRIVTLVDEIDRPILTGASEFVKFSRSSPDLTRGIVFDKKIYNSVFFIQPTKPITEPYRKMYLVPFAEYLPLEKDFSWPKWLIKGHLGLTPGSVHRDFQLGENLTLCPFICWEGLFSDFVRHTVRKKCSIIIQVTNNNWFGLSAASQLQNISAVFRAVETGQPVVVASNSGPSLFIDHHGLIVASTTALFHEALLVHTIRTCGHDTFYALYGDLFVLLTILALFGLSLYLVIQMTRLNQMA